MHILSIKDDPRAKSSSSSSSVGSSAQSRTDDAPAPVRAGRRGSAPRVPHTLSLPPIDERKEAGGAASSSSSSAGQGSSTPGEWDYSALDTTALSMGGRSSVASQAYTEGSNVATQPAAQNDPSTAALLELLGGSYGQFVEAVLAAAELTPELRARADAVMACARHPSVRGSYTNLVTVLKGPGTSEFKFANVATGLEVNPTEDRILAQLSLQLNVRRRNAFLCVQSNYTSVTNVETVDTPVPISAKVNLATLNQVVLGRRKALANQFPDLRSLSATRFATLVSEPALDLYFTSTQARDNWAACLNSILSANRGEFDMWTQVEKIFGLLETVKL